MPIKAKTKPEKNTFFSNELCTGISTAAHKSVTLMPVCEKTFKNNAL
jgi:hypothetical protein